MPTRDEDADRHTLGAPSARVFPKPRDTAHPLALSISHAIRQLEPGTAVHRTGKPASIGGHRRTNVEGHADPQIGNVRGSRPMREIRRKNDEQSGLWGDTPAMFGQTALTIDERIGTEFDDARTVVAAGLHGRHGDVIDAADPSGLMNVP